MNVNICDRFDGFDDTCEIKDLMNDNKQCIENGFGEIKGYEWYDGDQDELMKRNWRKLKIW